MQRSPSIRPKKSLGQHFLKDRAYLGKIVDAARIGPADRVLEIGPGLGGLTRLLAARAERVLALELDDRLIGVLRDDFAGSQNVEIVHGDALTFDYGSLAGPWKVVANLPYYISTPLVQRLIEHRDRFSTLTVMLQKEVAERIAAPPGGKEYGFLSVLVQLYTDPRMEFSVPPGAFSPPPDVESAVITLSVLDRPAAALLDEPFFFRLVKEAFSQRRKTLRNALRRLGLPPLTAEDAARRTGIDLARRPETLSVAEFAALADALR